MTAVCEALLAHVPASEGGPYSLSQLNHPWAARLEAGQGMPQAWLSWLHAHRLGHQLPASTSGAPRPRM